MLATNARLAQDEPFASIDAALQPDSSICEAFVNGSTHVPIGSQTYPVAHSSTSVHVLPHVPVSVVHAYGAHPETSSQIPSSSDFSVFMFGAFFEHAEHWLLHALSQQTPSTQYFDLHWSLSVHAMPCSS
jgi:hypothetical protein